MPSGRRARIRCDDATGVRRVRTRGTPVPQALEIRAGAAQPGDESGAFGVRVVRAETDPGRQTLLDATEQQRLQRLEAAINEAGDAISVVDPERLEFLEVNEGHARMSGLTSEEIRALGPVGLVLRTTSRSDEIHMHEGEASVRRELKARYDTLIANYPEATVVEVSFLGAGGREMRIETVRRAFRSYGRWLIIVVHRDITARYAASQRLQRLQAAMNQAADAIFVADPERMEYLDVNEAAGRLVGLSRQEVLAEGPLGIAKRLYGRTESEVKSCLPTAHCGSPELGRDQAAADGGWPASAGVGAPRRPGRRALAHHQHSPRRDRAGTRAGRTQAAHGGSCTVQPRSGAVRLRHVARPLGAVAHDHQLHAAAGAPVQLALR